MDDTAETVQISYALENPEEVLRYLMRNSGYNPYDTAPQWEMLKGRWT